MERGVRYDFELGLGSVLDLVAVAEPNPQKRARIVDKLAKKRAQLKAQQIRFDGGGRAAHAVPLDELKWIAAELESQEALAAVEDLHARAQARRGATTLARKAGAKPVTIIRYDVETGMGSVYDVLAMCRGAPLSKIQRTVVAPVMAKYNIPETKIQFPGKGQKPTPVAPYETLKRIVSDHRSPGAYVALRASANGGAEDDIDDRDLVKKIRFDPATKLGALHDVCVQCGCQRSALRDFAPAMCVFTVFPGKGQPQVLAAPPDVLAAAAFHLGRPDVGAAILRHLPGRRVVYDFEAPPDDTPRSGGGWVTPDMVLAAYGEYVRYDIRRYAPVVPSVPAPPPDWHQLFMPGAEDADDDEDQPDSPSAGKTTNKSHVALQVYSSWKPDSPPPPPPKRKQPPALPRLDVRYDFSDVWARKLFGRFVSSLPTHARSTWYYWPASSKDGLRTALEDAAVGLLVDELVARGTVVLDAGGSVSLWKLVQAAGALSREEAARLAHTAASHLAYDTVQAKCRSDYGPWPVWRGVRGGTRFDFKTNRPLRGLIVGSDNAAIARPPAFLDAWPETRAELCRYAGAMSFGGKETFFVVRGMRLLGDDQKDLEYAEAVVV